MSEFSVPEFLKALRLCPASAALRDVGAKRSVAFHPHLTIGLVLADYNNILDYRISGWK